MEQGKNIPRRKDGVFDGSETSRWETFMTRIEPINKRKFSRIAKQFRVLSRLDVNFFTSEIWLLGEVDHVDPIRNTLLWWLGGLAVPFFNSPNVNDVGGCQYLQWTMEQSDPSLKRIPPEW